MPTTDQAGFGARLPLAIRIFLLCALLIVLAVGAAIFFTWQQGQQISREAIALSVKQSAELQTEITQKRFAEIKLKTLLIAADPDFAEYVDCAAGQSLDLGGDCTSDLASSNSVLDLLNERREAFGENEINFDLGVVLDQEGNLLAQSGETDSEARNLSGDPFFGALVANGGIEPSFMQFDGHLYHAYGKALAKRDDVIAGFLVLGLKIDDAVSAEIAKYSGSQVAFYLPTASSKSFIASSLDAAAMAPLNAMLTQKGELKDALDAGKSERDLRLNFSRQTWLAQVRPVETGAPKELGAVLSMTSLDQATAGYDRLLKRVLIAGLGSLLFALPLSLLLSRPVLKPLRLMADAAEKAASGDFASRIGVRGNDALARLSQAFDSLLSSLREKDEMEGYVGSLSRLLPDAGESKVGANDHVAMTALSIAPELLNLHLLSLEYRQLALPIQAGQLNKRAEEFELIERRVNLTARAHGSKVVHNSGNRFVVGFEGSHGVEDALATFRELLDAAEVADSLGANAPSATLVQGDVLMSSGAPEFPSGPVILGTAAFQSDRLMTDSAPGLVIVGKPTVEILATRFQLEAKTHKGGVTGRTYFVFDRPALANLPRHEAINFADGATQDGNATQVNSAVNMPVTRKSSSVSNNKQDLMPGERFGGRYQILSILGSGGMGVVYKARDTELDDVVALKMLRTNLGIDGESLERLKSELKLARKISHPNVLKTFDFGLIDHRPFLSMEYIRGMTLRYLLEQPERVPYSAALRIAKQISAGLVAAHDEGVLHRDIKPENVIIEPSGNAKLMDFGIARPIRRVEPGQTEQGMYVGTPRYSAPEQLAGDDVDVRADVYAMGVLLSELFCGGFPYGGNNTMEIYLAQMQQTPVKPSELWPQIPPELEGTILRCIERERDKRFQNARELQNALNLLRV